jgi:macrolide transport system ATP-binding/permease protein
MNLALRIYRWLAEAFPHEFKLAYGAEVTQLGEDVVEEIAKRQGIAGLLRLIADIAMRVPLEYLSEMRQDMRYSLRALLKSPGFALVGIISIGLAIGLTTVVYSSELQTLFRGLPGAANAEQLVMPEKPVSYYYAEQYREQKNLFAGVAAFQNGVPFNVTLQGETDTKPERVFGQLVSPDYFSVLGVQAQSGRVFNAALDKQGDAPVVVVSDRFWRNRLNSSSATVGQVIRVNGQTATIVGIAPKDFGGAASEFPAELFVPTTVPVALAPELANDVLHQRNAREFLAIMCLVPGVTIDSAEAGLDAITRRLEAQDTSPTMREDKSKRVTLLPAGTAVPIPRKLRRVAIGFFVVLMGLVVTIACVNLSNMLLARAANRRRELAIRLSVGASRFRLLRQMMSEGILLSVLGGIAGFGFAYWLSVLNTQVNQPVGGQAGPDLTVDWHAALLALVLAIVCGIGLSLVPALQATKADLTPSLKEGSALQLPGHRRFGLRNLLMVTQVAGSLMLLLITGFLVIGINKISQVQTKFDANTMYLLSIDPVRDGYTPEKAQALFEKLPDRIKRTGGVRNVALAEQSPFSIEGATTQMTVGDPQKSSPIQKEVVRETVGPGYFGALSEPLLSGREFEEFDQRGQTNAPNNTSLPIILNESAARGFFGKGNAIGQRLKDEKQSYEVVGVVRDLNIGFGTRQSLVYLPLTARDFARPPAGGMTIMVRSDAGADGLNAIRGEIASVDPTLTIFNAQTLAQYLDSSRANMRFAVRTYGGIGLFGMILSAIGLAGITAYAVAQRRKEIGIRTAIGASKAQVLRLVLREGITLVSVGTFLGFVGAVVLAKILSAMADVLVEAFSVGTNDARLLVGAPLVLASLAMLACYLPARRAAQIDPLKALREE